MAANGEGIPQDYVEGYAWLAAAGANGCEFSYQTNAEIRPKLSSRELADARKRAKDLRLKYPSE